MFYRENLFQEHEIGVFVHPSHFIQPPTSPGDFHPTSGTTHTQRKPPVTKHV